MSLIRRRRYSEGQTLANEVRRLSSHTQQDDLTRPRTCAAGPNRASLRFQTPNGFKLSIQSSDITDERVDVIVNCNDEDLTGFSTGLPKLIIEKGGEAVFQKAQALVKKKERKTGEVLVTDSGSLRCHKIMHVIMSTNAEDNHQDATENVVTSATLKCLRTAHSRNMRSIAFPVIGLGRDLEYCAKDMLDALDDYMKTNKADSHAVTDVRFVFNDTTEYEVFRSELNRRYSDCIVEPHASDHVRLLESQLHDALKDNEELKTLLDNERQERRSLEHVLADEQDAKKIVERQLADALEAKEEAESQRATLQETLKRVEEQLANEQNGSLELERQNNRIQERADELQMRCIEKARESLDWVLNRDEVVRLPDKIIGRGAYGEVSQGTFRGSTVAVKRLNQIIISPKNRVRFEREMNMASRCRHPCLLQFIGATAEDSHSPLLVTELMETSLRALLLKGQLQHEEVSTISLDVSRGLNYLHLNRPDPIVHRNVSSGNVLLWRHNGSWRAKLSDYGTANFIQLCVTLCPGPAAYCAPEAANQLEKPTTKIDVYSFGVLLCEMSIPDQLDPTQRNEQVAMVTNPHHRELIKSSIEQDPEKRPRMAEIIEILERASETLRIAINETS